MSTSESRVWLTTGSSAAFGRELAHAALARGERFGRLDVLVNNAGYGSVSAIEEIVLTDLRTLMETMFFGAVALTQAALRHIREQGSGAIVEMSSMGGQFAPPGFGAYCAAKFALEAISEAQTAEVAPFNNRVLIVHGVARWSRSPRSAAP